VECRVLARATTPGVTLAAIRWAGATLIAEAATYEDAEAAAMGYAAERPEVTFVSSYSDPRIIAATGTIPLEIFDDDPQIDTIVVPVGGGGLIGGIALAAKTINPKLRVIGVDAANSPAMSTARRRGFVANVEVEPTLADAISGNNDPHTITFDYIQRFVDDIVSVSEEEIARAIRDLAGYDHLVVEGGGAVAVAALAAQRIDLNGGSRRVAAVVSGGNIDRTRLAAVLNGHGHAV
jgi:threonine dehydratase